MFLMNFKKRVLKANVCSKTEVFGYCSGVTSRDIDKEFGLILVFGFV